MYQWEKFLDFEYPDETGKIQYHTVVLDSRGKITRKQIEWKSHFELRCILDSLRYKYGKIVRLDSIIEDWVITVLSRYGNCYIGKKYPFKKHIYFQELARIGFPVREECCMENKSEKIIVVIR